jgi:hypothetical protein
MENVFSNDKAAIKNNNDNNRNIKKIIKIFLTKRCDGAWDS